MYEKIISKLSFRKKTSERIKTDARELYIFPSSNSKIWDRDVDVPSSCKARQAYTGNYVIQWLNHPLSEKNPWLFLSPRYGLIDADYPISNYFFTFNDLDNAITQEELRKQVLTEKPFGIPLSSYKKVHVLGKSMPNSNWAKVREAFKEAEVDYIWFGDINIK